MTALQDDINIDHSSSLSEFNNETSLFFNESFFKGKPDTTHTPFSLSSSSNSSIEKGNIQTSKNKQKRGSRSFVCKWCDRDVKSLWFQVGCVPECALSYFVHEFPELYNLAFIEVCKISDFEKEKVQPVCLPRRNIQTHPTPKSYWRYIFFKIYSEPADVRKIILRNFFSKNSIDGECSIDLYEKKSKKSLK